MIAQIVVFSRKTDGQRKKNFAFRSAKIAQKFCEWKPYLEVLEKIQEIIVISYFESEYFIIEPSKKFLVAPKLNSGHNPLESDFRLFPNSPNIHLLTIGIIV